MSEMHSNAGDWIESWIEQQRELLRRQPGQDSAWQELGRHWLDLGASYLKDFAQHARSDRPQAPGATAGESGLDEILDSWRNALAGAEAEQSDMGRRYAELVERLPSLGLAREQAQVWRELASAEAECRRLRQELGTVLSRIQSDALSLLEQRVRERREAGQPVNGFRGLYDMWIECGEQVYAQVAHGEAYGKLQAELGNATLRLRSRQQTVIEHALKQLDLPTRSELNSVHRQLRELRMKLAALERALPTSQRQPRARIQPARRRKRAAPTSKRSGK